MGRKRKKIPKFPFSHPYCRPDKKQERKPKTSAYFPPGKENRSGPAT